MVLFHLFFLKYEKKRVKRKLMRSTIHYQKCIMVSYKIVFNFSTIRHERTLAIDKLCTQSLAIDKLLCTRIFSCSRTPNEPKKSCVPRKNFYFFFLTPYLVELHICIKFNIKFHCNLSCLSIGTFTLIIINIEKILSVKRTRNKLSSLYF